MKLQNAEVLIVKNPPPSHGGRYFIFVLLETACGIKGVGEAGTVGALAAGMSAVMDALAQAGVESFVMPATPERVWRALQQVAG